MYETVIRVRDLNKTYGAVKAVKSLAFEVEKAECFGLLGPNGAGKTTTMKILYGKAEPDRHPEPLIDVFGYSPRKDALAIKALAGVVPQQDNLDADLNVSDNLYIYSRFYGMDTREARKRIAELLDFMELQEKAKASIRELSGGMQRRLTIARALLNQPRLLILDEPTTGLDPQVRHLIWNKIRELKEMGVTVLLTTHYMEEAFQISDRVIIMDKGKKILEGNPRKLLADNLENFVLEIYGFPWMEAGEQFARAAEPEAGIRHEIYQETLFVYSNDAAQLKRLAETLAISDYHVRQANLEDVFLKVTGRSLNELQ
ncbi:MAG: ABC transporter ATP-binding protein [Solirubrobacterales bacterium]